MSSPAIRRPIAMLAITMLLSYVPMLGLHAQDDSQANGDKPTPTALESPHATLRSFLERINKANEPTADSTDWQAVFETLDMRPSAGTLRADAARSLWQILNRLQEFDLNNLPAPKKSELQADQTRFELLPDNDRLQPLLANIERQLGSSPPTAPIALVRNSEGRWRFSSDSLTPETLNRWTDWLSGRESQVDVQMQNISVSQSIRSMLPSGFKGRYFLGVELWQWIGLAIVIFLAVFADFFARLPLHPCVRRLTIKYVGETSAEEVSACVRPMGLIVGAVVYLFLLGFLGITGKPADILGGAGKILLIAGIAWTAWSLADLLSVAYLKRADDQVTHFDDMIVPLLRKSVKLFIVAMSVLYIADIFAWQLMPLLGSLGIAGLAISFAAQDMVRNLFGGITIFLDQPFKIGDRIKYKGFDGNVEEVGFRVTRVRTLEGHLVTLPNGGITSDPIENISKRPSLRRIMNIGITYDTPREKIEQAVQIIRDILEEPDLREPIHQYLNGDLMAPRVFFNQYNADSLNIFVIYWYIPPEWWPYNEHAQKVNYRIFEEFEKAGIEFAFPTQTLYLAGDPNRQMALRMLGEDRQGSQ